MEAGVEVWVRFSWRLVAQLCCGSLEGLLCINNQQAPGADRLLVCSAGHITQRQKETSSSPTYLLYSKPGAFQSRVVYERLRLI